MRKCLAQTWRNFSTTLTGCLVFVSETATLIPFSRSPKYGDIVLISGRGRNGANDAGRDRPDDLDIDLADAFGLDEAEHLGAVLVREIGRVERDLAAARGPNGLYSSHSGAAGAAAGGMAIQAATPQAIPADFHPCRIPASDQLGPALYPFAASMTAPGLRRNRRGGVAVSRRAGLS